MNLVGRGDIIFFLTILVIATGTLLLVRLVIHRPFPYFFVTVLGAIVGLLLGSLVGNSFNGLPDPFGKYLPPIIMIFVAVAILDLFLVQTKPLGRLVEHWFTLAMESVDKRGKYILDSSVLIDGRFLKLTSLPLLYSSYVVPRFVVDELQKLSDSKDLFKRKKGRRGLDNLKELQSKARIKVYIDGSTTTDPVDKALVNYGHEHGGTIVTLDSNLARVSQIEGVSVLNINELINNLKTELMPGDIVDVYLSQKGRGHQAVGYLADGTMIVVEDASDSISKLVQAEIVKVHQTVNGQMYFASQKNIEPSI